MLPPRPALSEPRRPSPTWLFHLTLRRTRAKRDQRAEQPPGARRAERDQARPQLQAPPSRARSGGSKQTHVRLLFNADARGRSAAARLSSQPTPTGGLRPAPPSQPGPRRVARGRGART
ncbi:unnamed protein product [Rangifer tarandus platyrhynchus]|uniref:Uncharacterized protein n=2 Tax=Rangifer tarandus platyrhynchus TaxID=3082113 RepID=A0ABN8YNC6_RANTA|nr:unnamed protein product [Rangifer tarandus platyrhynchus]CAI9701545.1 unnamed protein product [Rangifer tarandus platyrhynchus]